LWLIDGFDERLDVRYWHKADMLNALANVRFWGQSGDCDADFNVCF